MATEYLLDYSLTLDAGGFSLVAASFFLMIIFSFLIIWPFSNTDNCLFTFSKGLITN